MDSLVLLVPPVRAGEEPTAPVDTEHALKPSDDLPSFVTTLLPARCVAVMRFLVMALRGLVRL